MDTWKILHETFHSRYRVTRLIRFDAVTKRYPDGTIAVDELNLEIPEGEITVLVGSSGCGKTTTLRMINRLIERSSGQLTIRGRDVNDMDETQLRRGIGYVIQQAGLFPHRTVLDNVATVPYLLGWSKKRARSRAEELLATVGLDPQMGKRYPHQLSGGQQQRVGVARALAADPPVLLMDEPFGAVDPLVRTLLQDELLKLQSQLHKTVVFVTHDLDEAIRLGSRIAVFRPGGHLVQFATPEELLTSPADEFVADFLGRDRGLKLLSLRRLTGVKVAPVATVRTDASVQQAHDVAGAARWVLAVDADNRPTGWLDVTRAADGTVGQAQLIPATGLPDSASVLDALEASLISPNGDVVRIDDQGRVRGVVRHAELAVQEQALPGEPAP
jgi:osmoprotectant transport system ATP-binding protein